ncbi:MAG: hypothetical protein HOQ22_12185, partial [Nocardioidaceae bacterium]|nr:hypothetical protein [Nocardioidaceae bacterium]
HRATPAPHTAGWRGRAGYVSVRCQGSSISLQSASPDDGYSVDVRERGPEEVEVRFEGGEHEARVRAECVDGRARFDVDND